MKPPVVDYKNFKFEKLNTDEFRHLKWIVFWPVFGLIFLFVERVSRPEVWHLVHCPLDDRIPFCEFFAIPYVFWFVYFIGMLLYTILYEPQIWRKMMKFVTITFSITLIIYLFFPNYQELRPLAFPRDNFLTNFMKFYYRLDTNTNVFPSLHVIGALAVLTASWHVDRFKTTGWKIAFAVTAVLICISTVFLKQHSVYDVLGALPICFIAYIIVYCWWKD